MFERFTQPAREAVLRAQEEARRLGHDHIGPEHLLLAVLADDTTAATVLRELGADHDRLEQALATLGSGDAEALGTIGIDLDAVRRHAEASFGPGALDGPPRRRRGFLRRRAIDHIPFTTGAKESLKDSLRQALALQHTEIGVEHLVLGLLAQDTAPAARTLDRLGVRPAAVRERLRAELGRAA